LSVQGLYRLSGNLKNVGKEEKKCNPSLVRAEDALSL